MGCGTRRRGRGQQGQAVVELALVAPVLLTLAFGILGIERIAQARAAVLAVAGEAARAAALADSPAAAVVRADDRASATSQGYGLTNGTLQVALDTRDFRRGGTVAAEATYVADLGDLPLLGWARVPVRAAAVEPIDPYRSSGLGVAP